MTLNNRPSVSTRMWRLRPVTFLPASKPCGSSEAPLFALPWRSGCRSPPPMGSPPRHGGVAHRRDRRPAYLGPEAAVLSPSACGRAQRRLRCRQWRMEDREQHLPGPRQGSRQPFSVAASLRRSPAPMARAKIAFHGDIAPSRQSRRVPRHPRHLCPSVRPRHPGLAERFLLTLSGDVLDL